MKKTLYEKLKEEEEKNKPSIADFKYKKMHSSTELFGQNYINIVLDFGLNKNCVKKFVKNNPFRWSEKDGFYRNY